jgi:hypothetical protein
MPYINRNDGISLTNFNLLIYGFIRAKENREVVAFLAPIDI